MNKKEENNKDCLGCKITGTIGLFSISVYIFSNARHYKQFGNKIFLNILGSGKNF
jgi:hypothetical protein